MARRYALQSYQQMRYLMKLFAALWLEPDDVNDLNDLQWRILAYG